MSKKAAVVFSDTGKGISESVAEVFEGHRSFKGLLKPGTDVYVKVNAVDRKRFCYTDPEVVRQAILYLKRKGAGSIFVMDNCTQSNFTRLVFRATGIEAVCRETGSVPVYLDETGSVPVYLETLETFIEISSFVYERLIADRGRNIYLSLPKLKTHSMSQVTLSIKNQFGFVHQGSRISDHNFKLHQKFADIYRIIRPDFVLVDGLIATNHGHYVAEKMANRCVVPMNCLMGGDDPLAVDVAAAFLMGYSIRQVEHLYRASRTGIGQGNLKDIEIVNRELFMGRRKKFTHELVENFPPDLKILRGRDRCCREGCRRNTETVAEVLYTDHGGKGGFTILMGKGIDPSEVEKIKGPVHLAGGCAIQDYSHRLKGRGIRVTMSNGCNNLSETVYALCRHMKVSPIKLAGINPLLSLKLLLTAKAKGTKAIIPPLL